MFENLSDKLDAAFRKLKKHGKLSEKNIEFIYDGHEPMHTSDTKEEDKIDECFFRVYLKPDKEEDLGEMSDGTKYKDILSYG